MSGHAVQQRLGSEASQTIRPKSVPATAAAWGQIAWAQQRWAELTLSTKFAIASCCTVATAMVLAGAWVNHRLQTSIIDNAAVASARVIERVIQSQVQDINSAGPLSDASKDVLTNLVGDHAVGHRILKIKLWRLDGTLAYTSNPSVKNDHPSISNELARALRGQLAAHLDRDHEAANPQQNAFAGVFEVYAPLYLKSTTQVIGVAEFYEDATSLNHAIAQARQQTWGLVGLLSTGMLAALFGIVNRGSALITKQRNALEATIQHQSILLAQNEYLQADNKQAHVECAELSDKIMRRVGADLHDGPAQLLGLALLRLDELTPLAADAAGSEARAASFALATIRSATQDALAEIRSISAGVALPDCDLKSTTELIQATIQNHERRTQTRVESDITTLPDRLPTAATVCLCRCVQEGLTNTFRHGAAKGQRVTACSDDHSVTVTISDTGPGFDRATTPIRADALGLAGLRHRVDLLNGTLVIKSKLGLGTSLTVTIPHEAAV